MVYISNPYAPNARKHAVNDVKMGRLTQAQAAHKYGVTRSAVCKWMKKSSKHSREYIMTLSSRPHSHPNQLPERVVNRIVELRKKLKRCAPVIHAHLKQEGYRVSLSSVGRVLKRKKLIRKKKQPSWYTPLPRPQSDHPGALVQVDTIHFIKPDHSRFYIYAVIDTYSRLGYAEYAPRLIQKKSHRVIVNAQRYFQFPFTMIQTDNGPEFKDGLQASLRRRQITLRHSRVRRPNDNAHVERFIRTIQEECFNGRLPNEKTIKQDLYNYIHYYNHDRLHLGINLETPTHFVSKVLK